MTMASLVLSPVPSNWLVVLLLLLSAQMMLMAKTQDLNENLQGSACSPIGQNPRFMARKRGYTAKMSCYTDGTSSAVSWLRKQETDLEPQQLKDTDRIVQSRNGSVFTLTIQAIQFEDNGIYFCQQNCTRASQEGDLVYQGCGTELRVMGFSTLAQMKRRNTLKDGIIMIQTLLIILFIVVPIFLLLDKDEGKAGMDEDHTYEGLNVDQTATYEDIVTLRTGEVKWSVGEHPGQE
ncbi:B-cell antigen receptor complex-associated protein beta chain [Nycticebus coucang]|uniref:B-cell antigen receptor complex-associated protein beta chain n=1 Tax=Nycticebus coucang TaxID=9470 RepID=UPI00234DA0C5|nr:B-cell antigen receptor complex-associated protein beta chain [Nycticebus coucang]